MPPAASPSPDPAPAFSALIRTASHAQHTEAESSAFMSEMLGGRLGVEAYTRYTEQLWFIYAALEGAAADLAGDPVAGPFVRGELFRLPALERDLAHLHGDADWRRTVRPLPATAAYADRIAEVARTWPGGYVAHHYTRYLGDLSGGQVIRGTAEKTGASPARATASASTCSTPSTTRPPSSANTAPCWTRCPATSWRSTASSRNASTLSR